MLLSRKASQNLNLCLGKSLLANKNKMGQRVVLRTVVRYTYTPHCHLFILVWHAFPLAKVSHLTFFFFWWSIFISWFSKLAQGGERERDARRRNKTHHKRKLSGSKLTRHQLLSPQRSAQNGPSLRTCLGSRLRGRGSPRRRGLDSDHGALLWETRCEQSR